MGEAGGHVVIIGSVNMDLVVRAPRIPARGETILGGEFTTIPGGKGANQAVAVARLGATSVLVGRVGEDDFGGRLLTGLRNSGVDCRHVQRTSGVASGIALIVVGDDGDNAITVASGANFAVTPADVNAAADVIRTARVCVLQLELPTDTVAHAIQLCRLFNVETILDPAPAPAQELPKELLAASIISPNETEAAALTGLPAGTAPEKVAAALLEKGASQVVLKLGARGAFMAGPDGMRHVEGFAVDVVDTTAAGDAFTGALAVARAEGRSLDEAVQFANAAGALACTQHGAQPSMPSLEAVQGVLGVHV
jgi:ribokinase